MVVGAGAPAGRFSLSSLRGPDIRIHADQARLDLDAHGAAGLTCARHVAEATVGVDAAGWLSELGVGRVHLHDPEVEIGGYA